MYGPEKNSVSWRKDWRKDWRKLKEVGSHVAPNSGCRKGLRWAHLRGRRSYDRRSNPAPSLCHQHAPRQQTPSWVGSVGNPSREASRWCSDAQSEHVLPVLAVLAGGAPWSTSLRGQEVAASYFHHHVGWNVPGAAEERPWIERVEHGGSLLVRARMVRRPIGPTNPLPGSINAPGRLVPFWPGLIF